MPHENRVILVDDEAELADALAEYLNGAGFRARAVYGGAELDAALLAEPANALVLDLSMPGEGGEAILRRIRPAFPGPILIASGNTDLIDRVLMLELGADDFLGKPIEPRELAARLRAHLGRYGAGLQPPLRFEFATVDLRAALLMHDDGRSERLQPSEIALLSALVDRAGRVVSREELLAAAPASDEEAFDRAVDSRISRLRAKLRTKSIQTVRGFGYRYDAPAIAAVSR